MWKWTMGLAVGWPTVHLFIFAVRFDSPPPWLEALWFVPTGLLGAGMISLASSRARTEAQRKGAILGFIAMTPFALAGNLLGGLAGPFGVTVGGVLPLLVGVAGGVLIGSMMPEKGGAAG